MLKVLLMKAANRCDKPILPCAVKVCISGSTVTAFMPLRSMVTSPAALALTCILHSSRYAHLHALLLFMPCQDVIAGSKKVAVARQLAGTVHRFL